jgi:hypothetical protein
LPSCSSPFSDLERIPFELINQKLFPHSRASGNPAEVLAELGSASYVI